MKNSEIHNGLPNQILRDFLATKMVKIFDAETTNKKVPIAPHDKENPFDWSVKDTENEIAFLQKKLQLVKQKQAVYEIIKMRGWLEHDVSDETTKDLPYKLHLNFIGTKQEYENLLKIIKK